MRPSFRLMAVVARVTTLAAVLAWCTTVRAQDTELPSPAPAPAAASPATPPEQPRMDAIRRIASARVVNPDDIRALERAAVMDPAVRVRFLAVRALERRGQGGPALATVLQVDPDARVRQAAARALGRPPPGAAQLHEGALLAALQDPSTAVAAEAAQSLGQVGSRAVLGPLERATVDATGDVRDGLREARKAILRRENARDAERARRAMAPLAQRDPSVATPLMRRAWGVAGTGILVAEGAAGGAVLGLLAPLAVGGTQGAWFSPLTAPLGAAVGAAAALGFAGVRRLQVPVTDALLVGVHGASGMGAGMGYGLLLGPRGSMETTATLAIIGGMVAGLGSMGVSPWMKTRPRVVLGAASGGAWGALGGLVAVGLLGRDPTADPERAAGMALVGQGLGVVLGTVIPAGSGLGAVDIAAMDVGGAMGMGAAAAGAWVLSARLDGRAANVVGAAATAGGAVLGAGAGLLLSTFLPDNLERRIEAGLSPEGWPVRLAPGAPVPTVNPLTGKPNGAVMPLLGGTFR